MLYQSHTGNVSRNSVLSGPVVERNVDALQAQIMAGDYVTLQEEAQEEVGPTTFERVVAFMFAGLLLGAMWWLVSEPKPDAVPHAVFLGIAAPNSNLPYAALYTKAEDKCANLPNVYIGNEGGWCGIFTGVDVDVPGFLQTDGRTAEGLAPSKNTTCPGEESACVDVDSKASKKSCCKSFFDGLKKNLKENGKEEENEDGDAIPCDVCVAFPANCPTTRYVQCLAHGAGGGNYGTWIANLAFNVLGMFPYLAALVSAAAMCSSACVRTSWVELVAESLEMLRWGIVLILFIYFFVVFLYGIACDYSCINYSCFGSNDASGFYSKQAFCFTVLLVLLNIIDFLILIANNPQEFLGIEFAEGAHHQEAEARVCLCCLFRLGAPSMGVLVHLATGEVLSLLTGTESYG